MSGGKRAGDKKLVKSYVGHLKDTLTDSPLPQQNAFIHSFVKEVEVIRKEGAPYTQYRSRLKALSENRGRGG